MKKKAFVLIGIIIVVFYSGIYLISTVIYKPKFEESSNLQENLTHTIIELQDPIQFKWKNNHELLMSKRTGDTKTLYIYNSETRKLEKVSQIKENEIFDLQQNKILYCEWKNYKIHKPDEIATKITIKNRRKEKIKTIESSQTIRPLSCSTEELYSVTSTPILETKFFKVKNLSNKKPITEEINKLPYKTALNNNFLPANPEEHENLKCLNQIKLEDITKITYSPNKKKVAIVDNDGLIIVISNFNCN